MNTQEEHEGLLKRLGNSEARVDLLEQRQDAIAMECQEMANMVALLCRRNDDDNGADRAERVSSKMTAIGINRSYDLDPDATDL